MHGELPKQNSLATLAGSGSSRRRYVIYVMVLIALAGALYYVFGTPAQQQRRASRFAAEGPVPVLVATAALADVPVYLDAVGTAKALNTVTVKPQVDGKLLSVGFKEGQDVKNVDFRKKENGPAALRALLHVASGWYYFGRDSQADPLP